MSRRKFTSKFKTKVVLEALKERLTLSDLAQKFNLQPSQISSWKKEFLNNADSAFEKGKTDKRSDSDKERDVLLRSIGELKIENDFLKSALR